MGKGKRERMHISWMKLEGSVKTSSEGREEKETKGREERRERQSVLLFCFSLSFCSLLKISIHVHTHSHMHAQTQFHFPDYSHNIQPSFTHSHTHPTTHSHAHKIFSLFVLDMCYFQKQTENLKYFSWCRNFLLRILILKAQDFRQGKVSFILVSFKLFRLIEENSFLFFSHLSINILCVSTRALTIFHNFLK